MAKALCIDTLKFSRKFIDTGVEKGAAEAIAEGPAEADTSDLATKQDLAEMVAQLLDFEVSGRLPASGHRVLVAQARPKPERAMRPAAAGACLSRPSQPFARRSWSPCPPRLGPFG